MAGGLGYRAPFPPPKDYNSQNSFSLLPFIGNLIRGFTSGSPSYRGQEGIGRGLFLSPPTDWKELIGGQYTSSPSQMTAPGARTIVSNSNTGGGGGVGGGGGGGGGGGTTNFYDQLIKQIEGLPGWGDPRALALASTNREFNPILRDIQAQIVTEGKTGNRALANTDKWYKEFTADTEARNMAGAEQSNSMYEKSLASQKSISDLSSDPSTKFYLDQSRIQNSGSYDRQRDSNSTYQNSLLNAVRKEKLEKLQYITAVGDENRRTLDTRRLGVIESKGEALAAAIIAAKKDKNTYALSILNAKLAANVAKDTLSIKRAAAASAGSSKLAKWAAGGSLSIRFWDDIGALVKDAQTRYEGYQDGFGDMPLAIRTDMEKDLRAKVKRIILVYGAPLDFQHLAAQAIAAVTRTEEDTE